MALFTAIKHQCKHSTFLKGLLYLGTVVRDTCISLKPHKNRNSENQGLSIFISQGKTDTKKLVNLRAGGSGSPECKYLHPGCKYLSAPSGGTCWERTAVLRHEPAASFRILLQVDDRETEKASDCPGARRLLSDRQAFT